jgi:mono/diheme cytochrome c family protein
MGIPDWMKWVGALLVCAGIGFGIGLVPAVMQHKPDPGNPDPKPFVTAAPKLDAGNAAEGEKLFNMTCVACHSIGQGVRVGPDLKGVTTRRDPAWLRKWLKDPTSMLASDPLAQELLKASNMVPMPPTGFSDQQVEHMIEFLKKTP